MGIEKERGEKRKSRAFGAERGSRTGERRGLRERRAVLTLTRSRERAKKEKPPRKKQQLRGGKGRKSRGGKGEKGAVGRERGSG